MVQSKKLSLSVILKLKSQKDMLLSNMRIKMTSAVIERRNIDFLGAYKQADGKKIDGKRVVVDCERGRTVKGWVPRRLGGGKGETRKTKEPEIIR